MMSIHVFMLRPNVGVQRSTLRISLTVLDLPRPEHQPFPMVGKVYGSTLPSITLFTRKHQSR